MHFAEGRQVSKTGAVIFSQLCPFSKSAGVLRGMNDAESSTERKKKKDLFVNITPFHARMRS